MPRPLAQYTQKHCNDKTKIKCKMFKCCEWDAARTYAIADEHCVSIYSETFEVQNKIDYLVGTLSLLSYR